MRAAGQGNRPRWDRPVAGRVRAARAAAAVALLGLIVVGLTSPGVRTRTWLAAAGGALVPYAYQAIQVQDATMPTAPAAVADGYRPANAVDGSSTLAWAVTWTDPDVPPRCGTSSSPGLLIRFTEPTTISRIILNAGLDPADSNRTRQVIPRVVDIRTSTGDCTRLDLTPDTVPQEFPVDLPRTSDVQVQIVDVHPATPGTESPGDQLAGLSEIRFYSG
jgi:hypothetical protein